VEHFFTYTQLVEQLISHIFKIISSNPRNIHSRHSRHFQELVCGIDKVLEAIAVESLFVWLLTLVMVHKEQDVVLCSVLESETCSKILLYLISLSCISLAEKRFLIPKKKILFREGFKDSLNKE